MDIKKARSVLLRIAENNGINIENVRSEIQKAIDTGFSNPDPEIRSYWESIPRKSEKPTPEEAICFMEKRIKKRAL
jgi:hypothetical protein